MRAIPSENYLVRPFRTHKTQTYNYTFLSGSNPDQVAVDLAVATPTSSAYAFDPATDGKNTSGIYFRPLFSSVRHLFYSSESIWNSGPTLDKKFAPSSGNMYVVSLAQPSYGEEVRRSSFKLSAAASTASYIDDGLGRIVLASNTASVLGNIFYELGIAVLKQSTSSFSSSILSHDGLFLATGSQLTVIFDASHTIYEHQVLCTMEEGELNYSSNPSMASSSSISGSVKTLDLVASGTLTPYITTVGLYTSKGELVAVAKFPRAIKRAPESQQTVIVRFDV